MRFRSTLLLLCLLSRAAPAAVSPAVDPEGQFTVGENGDARYSIALAAPKAIADTTPELTLSYSSQRGDDRLGVGWRLQGLSAITRCSAIPATDGFRGTVDYSSKDRFCLDGQRLVNVSGEYGSPGSVYRTEFETWRLVTASSDRCGSGPCSFAVVDRGGAPSSYGTTTDSRVLAVGRSDVRVWAIAQSSDRNGNTVSFHYTLTPVGGVTADAGQFYLDQIAYNTNPAAGLTTANRFLRFTYQGRSQAMSGYVGGSRIYTEALLSRIETYLGSQLVTQYRLSYREVGTGTGQPRLERVERCAGTGDAALCLPPTTVAYQGQPKVSFLAEGLASNLPASPEAVLPIDVNGDGKGDLAYVTGTSSQITVTSLVSNGSALIACPQSLSIPRPSGCKLDGSGTTRCALVPAAVDRSSQGGLVFVFASGTQLAYALFPAIPGGCSFSSGASASLGLPSKYTDLWPMDANGDGLTDLVGGWADTSKETVVAFLATGSGFTRAGSLEISLKANQRFWPAEVNGDGMLDLIQAWHTTGGAIQLSAFLSTGQGFQAGPTTDLESGSVSLTGLWPMDVNGDGKSDLVQGWAQGGSRLELSTFFATGAGGFVCEQPKAGGGFDPSCTVDTGKGLTDARAFWPMDADGDGRNDLVQAWQDGSALKLIVYRNANTGLSTGEAADASLASPDVSQVWPVDYNGDGKTDLIQATSGAGKLALTGYRSQGEIPDLVSTLTNNVGGRFTLTYKPLSDPAVYTPGSDAPPAESAEALSYPFRQASAQQPFQKVGGGKLSLVAELARSNDPAANASTYLYLDRYHYQGGLTDLVSGRGWLGFRRFEKLDLETGRRQRTTLNQGFPLTGTTLQVEYECDATVSKDPLCPAGATDTPLTDSNTEYQPVVVATGATSPNPKVYEVLKTRTVLTTYNYGRFDFARAKTFAYDAFGNLTLEADLGMSDAAGRNSSTSDDVYTCSRFDNQVSAHSWQLGFVLDRKVSSVADCTNFSSFNDATDFSLQHFTYTAAKNLESQAVYDNTNRVNLTTRWSYDAFGNQLSETQPGGSITRFEIESEYHTYPSCAVSPANQAGVYLVRYFGFDPRFGVQVASTTPAASSSTSCPALGRATATSGGQISLRCLDGFGRMAASQGPIPTEPAGVAGDANCVFTGVTGQRSAFTTAPTVTLSTFSRQVDGRQRVLTEQQNLQAWTLAGGSPDWRWSRGYVDGLGRTYLGSAEELPSVGTVAACINFDSDDKKVRQSVPRYFSADSFACTSSSGDSSLLWSTNTYDVYGRPTTQAQPFGPDGKASTLTTMSYGDRLRVTLTQAAGTAEALVKVLDYQYFLSDRMLVSLAVPADANATSTYGYDRIGRLLSATDPPTTANPRGVSNQIRYDSLNRRTSVDNPDQNSCLLDPTLSCPPGTTALKLAYDPTTGLLSTTTDAAERTTRFFYDGLRRTVKKELPEGAGSAVVSYGYDDPATPNGLGEQTSVESTDRQGVLEYRYAYAYDAATNQVSTRFEIDGTRYTTKQVFDPQQRVSSLTYPDGFEVTHRYSMGNLAEIRSADHSFVELSDYAAVGGPQRMLYGNGASALFSYAPTGQPLSEQAFDASSTRLADYTLSYNALLQVTGLADHLKPGGVDFSQSYGYRLSRLVSASAPGLYGDLSFGYDAEGNLTAKEGYAFAYQAHRVVAGTGSGLPAITLHYDRTGNLDRRTVAGSQGGADTEWSYEYDVSNQLTAVKRGAETQLSVPLYNDSGSRLRKLTPDGVETLYVSPLYQITRFPDGARELTKVISTPGGTVATVTTVEGGSPEPQGGGVPSPGTLYFFRDYLGSTSLTTGEDGKLSTRMAYLPYGGTAANGTTGPNDFRPKFQGQELDQTANLYYFGARYYDPMLGRFLSPDTQLASALTTIDTLNRYAFALNNPVTFIDPTGNNVWDAIGGALIGIAEIVVGVAIDVLSDGALEPLAGAFIGAGMNGVQYSATHSGSFSWKQYGVQQGEGAAFGLVTGGFGGEAEAGVSAVSSEAAEEVAATAASEDVGELALQNEGRELASGTDTSVAELDEPAGGPEGMGSGSDEMGSEGGLCSASFPAGETVWTSAGRMPVEQVSGEERLISQSSLDFAPHERQVLLTLGRLTRDFVVLELADDAGEIQRITTTPNHPFWVLGQGWRPAGSLEAGEHLATLDGDGALLLSVSPFTAEKPRRVFNFEVATDHSYFVGKLGVWAHNPLCDDDYRRDYGLSENWYQEEGQFDELPVNQFLLSDDMIGAVDGQFQDRLYTEFTEDYGSPINPNKLRTVDEVDYPENRITPLAVKRDVMTDDDEPIQLFRIQDGRHRFIWYVNNNFGRVPVKIVD